MNTIIVTDKNRGCYGALLDQQFRQRRNLFIGEYNWEIPNTDTLEADQYDRPDTVYILVEDKGTIVAYARLVSAASVARYGRAEFSYMVRDAVMGEMPGIPTDILGNYFAPQTNDLWEMTRVEAAGPKALKAMFQGAASFLKSQKAKGTITFTRASFQGVLNRLGFPTFPMGPSYQYSGKDFCVLATDLTNDDSFLQMFEMRTAQAA